MPHKGLFLTIYVITRVKTCQLCILRKSRLKRKGRDDRRSVAAMRGVDGRGIVKKDKKILTWKGGIKICLKKQERGGQKRSGRG